jgi:hypothetical protein
VIGVLKWFAFDCAGGKILIRFEKDNYIFHFITPTPITILKQNKAQS